MNNKQQSTDFSSERQECNDIYQVLGHSAIFSPLLSCVFPDLQEIPNKREERELFLQQPENIGQILDFFKDQEKFGLFEKELLSFYNTHKEALKPTEAQKNIVGLAIGAMKKYISNLSNKIKPNLSITDTTDNVKGIQETFKNLVSKQLPEKEILSDIGGNIINDCETGEKILLFNKEVAKVQGRFIDVETRVPIVIQGKYIITNIIGNSNSYYNVDLYDTVKKQFILRRYLKDDFTILTDNQGNEIIEVGLQREFFGKKVKPIKIVEQGKKNGTEFQKFMDSEFDTLRDEKGNEITGFYQGLGNTYIVYSIDNNDREIINFYDKEGNEIKGFIKNLGLRLLNIV